MFSCSAACARVHGMTTHTHSCVYKSASSSTQANNEAINHVLPTGISSCLPSHASGGTRNPFFEPLLSSHPPTHHPPPPSVRPSVPSSQYRRSRTSQQSAVDRAMRCRHVDEIRRYGRKEEHKIETAFSTAHAARVTHHIHTGYDIASFSTKHPSNTSTRTHTCNTHASI